MNRSRSWAGPNQQPETISGERRRDKRYDVALEMRWKLIRRRKVLDTGVGRTVDLSSGGILVETDQPLPVGLNLELSIAWPILLRNVAPLQLVVDGRIVRAKGNRVAIRMIQHQFRTVGAAHDHDAAVNVGAGAPLSFLANPEPDVVSWNKPN